jgi:hypothetical protein
MRVEIFEPGRVLSNRSKAGDWVWTFVLVPENGSTRLISRNRIGIKGAAAGQRLGMPRDGTRVARDGAEDAARDQAPGRAVAGIAAWRARSSIRCDANEARVAAEILANRMQGADSLTGDVRGRAAAAARSGIDAESIQPPAGGRAPGWQAGLVVARTADKAATETAA